MAPEDVVIGFNNCINTRDLSGLEQLMADYHSFIDSGNNVVKRKINCLNAWKAFFNGFPDYKNIFHDITAEGSLVKITGHVTCSAPILEGPAIWTATLENDKVKEWRVFEDNSTNRKLLNIAEVG